MSDIVFKISHTLWEEAEKTGFRNVKVSHSNKNIFSIIANKQFGEWKVQCIPMGYSFDLDDVIVLEKVLSITPAIMDYISRDCEYTSDEVQETLNRLTSYWDEDEN